MVVTELAYFRKITAMEVEVGTCVPTFNGQVLINDRIAQREIVPNLGEYVYCMTVDEDHTLAANGIFTGQCDGDEDCPHGSCYAGFCGQALCYEEEDCPFATTCIGLIPIMWATGAGSDVMKRIAAPMIGGIATSFILELVVYPGEPHGLTTYDNRLAKMQWDLAWFDRYLMGNENGDGQ